MANTKLQLYPHAEGAGGAELSVSTTAVTLTPPAGPISYRIWLHNPAGSGVRVYVIASESANTTSAITLGEGESLQGLGPFFSEDLPQIIADGAGTVLLTWEGVKSEV